MKFISNKTLFRIHGWLGLNFGLLLFVICISGTFATLSNEADRLMDPGMQVEKSDEPVQWQKMVDTLSEEFPEGQNLGIYLGSYTGNSDAFATTAYVSLPNGQSRKIYLNPYSGEMQADRSFFNIQRFFRSFHRRFFDGDRGIFIVTLTSFFLLFSALTGFLFYKGWLKNLFTLRLQRNRVVRWSDIHKLTGIWSLLFTLLIALTGVFYFIELMYLATDNYERLLPEPPPPIENSHLSSFGHAAPLLSADTYIRNAKEAFPGLEIRSLRMPNSAFDYVYADGQAGNPLTRDRANKVFLHPFTGEVAHIQYSSELNAAEFITDAVDPLHFGYFWGLPTKIIWFIFGLMLSLAILSGVYMWYIRTLKKLSMKRKKTVKRGKNAMKKESKPVLNNILGDIPLMRGAVVSVILTLIYFLVITDQTINGIGAYNPSGIPELAKVKEFENGPWKFTLFCEQTCMTNSETSYVLKFHGNEMPVYEKAVLSGKKNEITLSGSAYRISGKGIAGDAPYTLEIFGVDGNTHRVSIEYEWLASAENRVTIPDVKDYKTAWAEANIGIKSFIWFFVLFTASLIIAWLYLVVKATITFKQA